MLNVIYVTVCTTPLVSSITAGLFGQKIGEKATKVFTSCCMFATASISWWILYEVAFNASPANFNFSTWMDTPYFKVSFALMFDSLTATLLTLVTTISLFVHIYFINYMTGDPQLTRLISYLSLFTFFMLILVTAHSFFLFFIGWAGLALSLYLLINLWHRRFNSINLITYCWRILILISTYLANNKLVLWFLILITWWTLSNDVFCMEGQTPAPHDKVWDARDFTAQDHARNWQNIQKISERQANLKPIDLAMDVEQLKLAVTAEWNLRGQNRILKIPTTKRQLRDLLWDFRYDRYVRSNRKVYRKLWLPIFSERIAATMVTNIFKELFKKS